MDPDSPRGDGIDHSGDNAKLGLEPRGFFADQFEVCFFLFPPMFRRCDPVGLFCGLFLRLEARNMPTTL